MESVALLHCGLTMAVTLNLWARGNPSAAVQHRLEALLIFTVVNLLALNGVLPLERLDLERPADRHVHQFVLLSMALAERINIERNRRIAARQLALETSESLAAERALHLQAKQEALDCNCRPTRCWRRGSTSAPARWKKPGRDWRPPMPNCRLGATDALTQLANRRRFDSVLDEEIRRARRSGSPLAVLLADIDHFKRINDSYGHPFGDECLRGGGGAHGALPACRRPGGTLWRHEEFIVLLPASDQRQAVVLAERIPPGHRAPAAAPRRPAGGVDHQPWRRHAGVDLCLGRGAAGAADAALYAAKHAGRNRVVCAPEAAISGETGPGVSPQPA